MAKIGGVRETQSELTVEWEIEDFFSLPETIDVHYESDRFYFCGASWNLWLYPNGEKDNKSSDYVSLYLIRKSFGTPVTLKYTLGLEKADGSKETASYTYTFDKKNSGYGCPKLINRSTLKEKKMGLSASDSLTFFCTLKDTEKIPVGGSLYSRLQDVSDNLMDIYTKRKKTDLQLKVDGGNLQAHRMILETRSPVFAAMFSHETRENLTGEIVIEDLDKSTMEAILDYLYSGDIDTPTTKSVLPIYAAAEKYDIKYVKEMCIKFITLNLSKEWVCDVIKFAELYEEKELGLKARNYFKENAGAILESDEWKTFAKENHDLGVELLASLVKSLLPK